MKDAGVDVLPSGAGFYLFPNFEVCRAKLAQKGVKTGQDFCDLLFEEQRIAVSFERFYKNVPFLVSFLMKNVRKFTKNYENVQKMLRNDSFTC